MYVCVSVCLRLCVCVNVYACLCFCALSARAGPPLTPQRGHQSDLTGITMRIVSCQRIWTTAHPQTTSLVYLVVLGHPSRHDELDHPPLVALHGHGGAEVLHGLLVGHVQQRLAVDGDQLVVDAKASVLRGPEGGVRETRVTMTLRFRFWTNAVFCVTAKMAFF